MSSETSQSSSLPRIPVSLVRAAAPWKRSANATTVLPDARKEVSAWVPDRGRLADFRRVVSASDAAEVPITFPQVPVMALHLDLISSLSFPIKAMGVVHLASDVQVHGELPVDAPWTVRAWVGPGRHVRSGLEFDLCGEIRIDDELVWSSRAINLSRGKSARGAEPSTAPEVAVPVADEGWSEPVVIPIGEGTGRAFGRVTGDVNPIHMHALPARLFGFPSAIAHGWWTTARILGELGSDASEPGRRVQIVYRRPVRLPSKPQLLSRELPAEQDGVAGSRFALVDPAKEPADDGALASLVYGEVTG